MAAVSREAMVESDLLLSIVPPSEARATAALFVPLLRQAARKPVYVDCNAVSPETAGAIAEAVAATGAPFVDAGIIGGPPRDDGYRPAIYASGAAAARLAILAPHGLDIRVMDAPVGAASALKMAYAGITKGCTALGAAMALAAGHVGAGAALHAQLAESEPAMLAWLSSRVPAMLPKAYRFAGEMEEIAAFAAADGGTEAIYRGAGTFYQALATDVADSGGKSRALRAFFTNDERNPP
jgi:3-hydroxyisobutyrate dehydrogenase-like beta-hydroxyacid dehydrogenase